MVWCQPAGSPSWQDGGMEHVLGIGGYFVRAADPAALSAWYRDCLGLDVDENGLWRQGTGPHPVIIVGYLAEGGRPSFTSSHVRTLTRVPSPIPGHHWPRTVICGGQHAQLGPFGTVCLANLAVRLLPYGSRVRRAATARSGCPQDR